MLGFPSPLDHAKYGFGPYTIPESQVFYATPSSLAFVNIRPVSAGTSCDGGAVSMSVRRERWCGPHATFLCAFVFYWPRVSVQLICTYVYASVHVRVRSV